MKVMHVFGCGSVQYGSFERSTLEIARILKKRDGKLCLVYDNMPENQEFVMDLGSQGVEIITCLPKSNIFSDLRALYRVIKANNPDILHAHFQYRCYLVALLNFLFFKKPIVVTRHFVFPDSAKKKSAILYNLLASVCSKVITVSKAAEADLVTKVKIPSGKIQTIYLGVDLEKYKYLGPEKRSNAKKAVTATYKLPEDCKIALTTSHFRPGKGIETVIDAAKTFAKDNVYFLIAGDGPLRGELQKRINDAGISNVLLIGIVQNIPELLAAADIFIFPTGAWPEGLPMSLIEALASGSFIISTSVIEDLKDLLHHNKNALIFKPDNTRDLEDKIKLFLDLSVDEIEKIRGNAFKSAQVFDVGVNVNKLVELYESTQT